MEMGVRLALGARRSQLITQLLTESVLLASLGALAGLIVANWTLTGIAALLPPDVDQALRFALQPVVLVFAGALALATGIAFGMFPALHSTRAEVVAAIRANAGQISGARGSDVYVQGFPSGPDVDKSARFSEVGAGHFATLGVQVRAGREFTKADHRGAPRVAVVNQAFVKKFNLGQGAVGKFMSIGPGPLNTQIVGVIPDVKYSDVKEAVPPLVYTPWRQATHVGTMNFYVRSARSEALLRALPAVLKQIDPGLPMNGLKTMPEQIRENVSVDRLISILSASFAVLATLLAAVGLYGVLAYSVAQRTREIGVRMALGADSGRVRAMVLRQVSATMLVGGGIGLVGALGLGRAARSLLYGLEGHDPVVFALAVPVLTVVAFGGGFVRVRHAFLV